MNVTIRMLCAALLIMQSTASPPAKQGAAPPQASTADSVNKLAAACPEPCLEDGTLIKLKIMETVSSADAQVGERIGFQTEEDTKAGGVVVIPKGAMAWGRVTEAKPKRRMGRAGKLEITMDSVRLADGERAALRATKEAKGAGHQGRMAVGIVAAGVVFFPVAPLFLLMHGKDISIPQGTEVTTFVDGNFRVDLSKFPAASPAPAQPASTSPVTK